MDPHSQRPFLIEHRTLEEAGHHFVPTARLVVTPALRESGLLSLLSDKQARLVLALLTFVSPNGQVQATAKQVARALGVPAPVAALWLLHFASRRFHGAHLIYRIKREEGYPIYALSRGSIDREHQPPRAWQEPPTYRAAGRAAVIAHSRATYTKPRAEVERTVMEQLGHAPEELLDTPEGQVWRLLGVLHLEPPVIRDLIAEYGVERILRQLTWLPLRKAKNPARYLLAAIKGDYSPPLQVRLGRDGPSATARPDAGVQQTNLTKGDDA